MEDREANYCAQVAPDAADVFTDEPTKAARFTLNVYDDEDDGYRMTPANSDSLTDEPSDDPQPEPASSGSELTVYADGGSGALTLANSLAPKTSKSVLFDSRSTAHVHCKKIQSGTTGERYIKIEREREREREREENEVGF